MRRFSGVTTAQLARICGVSQGTVDRALHNRGEINEETKARILEVAREYGYTPSVKNARGGKSMLIGVVLFDLYNSFFSKLSMSLVECAKSYGYSVIFQFSNKNPDQERSAIDYFNYIGVDGIILFPIGSDSPEYSEYLRSAARPILTIGNRLAGLEYIGTDDEAAMCALTEKMLEQCEGEIAYFAPILKRELHKSNAQLLRRRGYERAMEAAGRKSTVLTDISELSESFSGIISSTDHYLLQVLARLGGTSAVTLAGFDNTDSIRRIGGGVLSVEYSTDKIAEECLKYILGRRFSREIPYTVTENR